MFSDIIPIGRSHTKLWAPSTQNWTCPIKVGRCSSTAMRRPMFSWDWSPDQPTPLLSKPVLPRVTDLQSSLSLPQRFQVTPYYYVYIVIMTMYTWSSTQSAITIVTDPTWLVQYWHEIQFGFLWKKTNLVCQSKMWRGQHGKWMEVQDTLRDFLFYSCYVKIKAFNFTKSVLHFH